MNMTLSKRGDYVVRSAIALARSFDSGEPRKIRQVVADTEVPRTFASQILADLVRAGLAVSKAGRDGGYWLARPPADISVLDVIEAAEGPLRSDRCALGEGPCRWDQVCPLHETWAAATAELRELLSRTSLAEVAARDAAIEAGTYDAPADAHRSHTLSIDVADVVQVELPADAVHRLLPAHGDRLGPLVADAARRADGDGAGPDGPGTGPVPAACSLAGTRRRPTAGEPAGYLLSWRLSGPEASHLDGEVTVAEVDAERSELRLSGLWHQEPSAAGLLTTAELDRMARRVVRGFLRLLARALEEDAGVDPVPAGATRAPRRRVR